MILAFAGAWLLTLPSAIWAIIGANVWSTMLWVLVVYVGFSFKIGAFALGMAAIGWLMNKFLLWHTRKGIGKIILAFGFMFFGISLLRDAVVALQYMIDRAQFANTSLIVWFLVGIVVTAALHSSGAMSIIVLWLLYGGLVDFPQAMMLIAWSNIGTCITAIWGAMGWSAIKKQVAASHIIFNVVSWVLVIVFRQPLDTLFHYWFTFPEQATTALAMFQLFYNIIWALLFYPFIWMLARFLQRIYHKEKADYILGVKWLELSDMDVAIPVVRNDIIMLLKKVFKFNVHHLRIDQKALMKEEIDLATKTQLEYVLSHNALAEDYHNLKNIEEELLTYILKALNQPNLSKDNVQLLHLQSNAIERILYAAKAWQDTQHNIHNLYQSDNEFIRGRLLELKTNMIKLYLHIIPIIDGKDINENYDNVTRVAHEIRQDNKKFIDEISDYVTDHTLENWLLSGLFHLVKAFERSNDAILDALKYVFLDNEQRKYAK